MKFDLNVNGRRHQARARSSRWNGTRALPPVIPALCNAIYSACGKRMRRLPIEPAALATAQA